MFRVDGKSYCSRCMKEIGEEPCSYCGYPEENDRASSLLPVGTKLDNGRYLIGKLLGKGGFGITYLGYDLLLKRRVAIKEFYPNNIADRFGTQVKTCSMENPEEVNQNGNKESNEAFQIGLEKFLEESKQVSYFNGNPNIVSVYDCFRENHTGYFTMEYLEGLSVNGYVQKLGRPLNDEEVLHIAKCVLDALMIAHSREILHRDVAPNNIMICKNGKVKLIDFGAARQVVKGQTGSLSAILNPSYAPPEQYDTKGKQGPWTDLYALGSSMLWMLTGGKLTDALHRTEEKDREVYGKIKNSSLLQVIKKSRELDPKKRYQSAMEMRATLNALTFDDSAEAEDITHTVVMPEKETFGKKTINPGKNSSEQNDKASKPPKRQKLLGVLVLCAALVLAGSFLLKKPGKTAKESGFSAANQSATAVPVVEVTPKPILNTAVPTVQQEKTDIQPVKEEYREPELTEIEQERLERANKMMKEKDYAEAAKWLYQLADEKNVAEAQYMLADCYLSAENNFRDEGKGIFYARQAADQLHPEAMYLVGYCYRMGYGTESSYKTAAEYFQMAADHGSEKGMLWIGYSYHKGEGVNKDKEMARSWYELLIETGTSSRLVKQAKERLSELGS